MADTHDTHTTHAPTLGVMLASFDERLYAAWRGIQDVCREQGANVVGVTGLVYMRQMYSPTDPAGIAMKFLNSRRIDGIITLQFWDNAEWFRTFYEPFRPRPVVTVFRHFEGDYAVDVDLTSGVGKAIEHLITAHGCRRILYFLGEPNNMKAEERYHAYRETLQKHGIAPEERLLVPFAPWEDKCFDAAKRPATLHTYHARKGWENATWLLEEAGLQPGRDFDAIAPFNDEMARGILAVLHQHGFDVPDDVRLVGVDNHKHVAFLDPPLTSVGIPWPQWGDMGRNAADVLLRVLRGEDVPQWTMLPGQLILRESCGCLDRAIARAAGMDSASVTERRAEHRPATIETWVDDQIPALLNTCASRGLPVSESQLRSLLTGWRLALTTDTPVSGVAAAVEADNAFIRALKHWFREADRTGQDPAQGHDLISTLWSHLLPGYQHDAPPFGRTEALWHEARVLADRFCAHSRLRRQEEEARQHALRRKLEQQIMYTFDVPRMMDVLHDGLPTLGIQRCCLWLFDCWRDATIENPPPFSERAFPVLLKTADERLPIEDDSDTFASLDLAPDAWWPDANFSCLAQLLWFNDTETKGPNRHFGMLICEDTASNTDVYMVLRDELSSALQGAMLMTSVREHAAEIDRQKYILDTFMANVPDSIYFKDRESRFLRVNKAQADAFGAASPDDLAGKSDFDFFPEEQARPKFDEEQRILQTGAPLLAMEEPDAGHRWSLTTKMPLRDERGSIIGTFGISRDITPLKQAQEQLAQAYSEISALNTQLQEENLRMGAELDVARRLQAMLVPRPEELEGLPGLEIAGYMKPADEVGGDYYDVLQAHKHLHVGIGDVTGHGLESGVIMLMTQMGLRTLLEHGETDLIKMVVTLNRTIYKNVQRMGADKTLTFSLVNYHHGQLTVVGQHEEVLVVRRDGRIEHIDTMLLGFPLGLEEEIADWVATHTVNLNPGDGIALYTDGITEAENQEGRMYGLERLCRVLSEHWALPAQQVKQAVVDDVFAFIGEQKVFDDVTLVVVKQQDY